MNDKVTPSKSGGYLDSDTWDAMRAMGHTEEELLADQPFGPMIFSYTRAQAIEDGQLVDLTAEAACTKSLCREAGFKVPIAMTVAAFHETLNAGATEKPAEDGDGTVFDLPSGQSIKGRAWDVLTMLRLAIGRNANTDRIHFRVLIDTNGDGKHKTVKLWSLIGPGDTPEPVLTIMLEGED